MKKIIKHPANNLYVVKCKKCKCKYLASISEFYKGFFYYHIDCPACGETRQFESLTFLRRKRQ